MPRAEDKENAAGACNAVGGSPGLRRGKTIEQIYQKKTQLEHILLRPDTYVGSVEHQFQEMFVFDERTEEVVHRKIDYVPALYKIFDEILVNAADNLKRDPKGMDTIDVHINKDEGYISVYNNGRGIPVQVHKEHNIYVPEMIFGHLLTSDNYNDNEKKVTGGRNGFGAKLTNVFSKKFIIETADKSVKKKFMQIFENNMSTKSKPKITDYSGQEYTKVTFWPDFEKFGMQGLDEDIAGLMMKRVYDIAGSTGKKCKISLNGKPLAIKSFQDYVHLYVKEDSALMYENCSDRWEVAVGLTDGSFQQVSFVNSINTIKGGTHVAHVTEQLVEAILKVVKGKNRGGMEIKPAHVKNHLFVFINCLIENPAFDSQTKETLTTKVAKFGSACELSEKFMKQVMKSGVVETILDWAKAKQKVDLGRQMRGQKNVMRVSGIPKLEDANDAGGKHSQDCTLILTEGDSAKALAVAGMSVVGRDRYGVFPLKGKVLNVRDANYKQVSGNQEIMNLLKIMGLDIKREYSDARGLRYGSIMLMTDQDYDGSHIKGLLINLVSHWWPGLFKSDGFLKEFVTPIVKVWKEGKGANERKEEKSFFTMAEYEKWKNRTNNGKGWKTKYYKGLGTSTAKEAKEYFKDIENHELAFKWLGDDDEEAIDLAFRKTRADDRKEWINSYEDGTHVDHTQHAIPYYDFVHKELVQFAKYDVSRSVPSAVDGFKPSQRKVLFSAFKKKLKSDIKVAQFVGYISEQSAYHHGEASLENTIVNLAQTFVGSNNINLLFPSGQFGTRLMGGKDHAAARYIYTRLSAVTRLIFHPDDDNVLDFLEEEGQSIEPAWYCPIIPTVLVNGAEGIGVGWSTSIPNYNPRDLIRNIRRMLHGKAMEEISPWYKNFSGSISLSETVGKFEVVGCIQKTSETTLEITELPLKNWTQAYKEFLETLLPSDEGRRRKKTEDDEGDGEGGGGGGEHVIEDYREYHTENTVHFVLTLKPDNMKWAEEQGLEKVFKLRSTLATSNMVLFDQDGKIAQYRSALDILQDFCKLRKAMYDKRKAFLVAKLTREKEILSNKARFILMVVKGELELRKKKKADLLRELEKKGFAKMSDLDATMKKWGKKPTAPAVPKEEVEDEGEAEGGDAEKSDYDYLLGMNLWSLTYEKVEEIKKQHETKAQELQVLQKTSIEEMWDRDLQALSDGLDELEALEQKELQAHQTAAEGRRNKVAAQQQATLASKRRTAPVRKATKRGADDDDDFSQPPQEGAAAALEMDAGQKTTWGSTGPMARKAPTLDLSQASQQPPQAKRGRGAGGGGGRGRGRGGGGETLAAAGEAEAVRPAQDETGASLLSRLLSKSSDGPARMTSLDTTSHGSYQTLSSSDDFFSYLHSSSDSAYNSLDLGAPPGMAEEPSLAIAEDACAEAPASRPGRGGGRGKGRGRGASKKSTVEDAEDEAEGKALGQEEDAGSPDMAGEQAPKRRRMKKSPLKESSNVS